jgi:hypothetical protein
LRRSSRAAATDFADSGDRAIRAVTRVKAVIRANEFWVVNGWDERFGQSIRCLCFIYYALPGVVFGAVMYFINESRGKKHLTKTTLL